MHHQISRGERDPSKKIFRDKQILDSLACEMNAIFGVAIFGDAMTDRYVISCEIHSR